MEQRDIHDYLEKFFRASGCELLENDGKSLNVQLTVDMDKRLMNRPFYWKYVENTGMDGEPLSLRLITDPERAKAEKGEFIHFGSPRLHQIFRTAKQLGSFVRLYEQVETGEHRSVPLDPWLLLNLKISYQCDRKKDRLESYGLHLINGQLLESMQERLDAVSLTPKIPDYCFTISPIIKPNSGLKRVEQKIQSMIAAENDDWAEEARRRWAEDFALLKEFYETRNEDDEEREWYEKEQQALKNQYEPKVDISLINAGLVYLTKRRMQ
ncbi:MAG TPA: YqhG family protein [Bacillales bacterium]|nr:YqhG family protein [Bacillales bacterium]